MGTETKSTHITPVGGNVFADLGFAPEEAAALKAESRRVIAEKLAVKTGTTRDAVGRTLAAPRLFSQRARTATADPDTEEPGADGGE